MNYCLKNKCHLYTCRLTGDLDLNYSILRDGEEVDEKKVSRTTRFHIKNNDYLGTTATLIDLHLQMKNEARMKKSLAKIRDDLIYLQKNYRLVRKMTNE